MKISIVSLGLFVLLWIACVMVTDVWSQSNPVPMVKTISPGTNVLGNMAKASSAYIGRLNGVCAMQNGEIYISDSVSCNVRKINKEGIIVPHAGIDFKCGSSPDITQPLSTLLRSPSSLACDSLTGNVYLVDDGNVRKITKDSITTVSSIVPARMGVSNQIFFNPTTGELLIANKEGGEIKKITKEGIEQVVIRVEKPVGVVQTNNGVIYISTERHVIYSLIDNKLAVFAGKLDVSGYVDGALANSLLNNPGHLAFENGELFVNDFSNYVVRKISQNTIKTVIGNGINGYNGDGFASDIQISIPISLSFQQSNLLLIDDKRLRVFDQKYLTTLIENQDRHFIGYDVPQEYSLFKGREFSVNSKNDIFVLNSMDDVLKISNGFTTKLLNSQNPYNIAINKKDEIFIGTQHSVYNITSGQLEHIAFDETFPSGQSIVIDNIKSNHAIIEPNCIAISENPSVLYSSETAGNRIRILDFVSNIVSTFIGDGNSGFSDTHLDKPRALVITPSNDLIFSELGNNVIRKKESGKFGLKLIAGRVKSVGYSSGLAVDSLINQPYGLFLKDNKLYLADTNNCLIRMINLQDGIISDIAGTPTICGFDDGPANTATFAYPKGLVVLDNGDILVADTENNVIRKISNGQVTTLSSSDSQYRDGPIGQSTFNSPSSLDITPSGDILVRDSENSVIRMISNGIVSTIAGTPKKNGFKGENVNAKASSAFYRPSSVKSDRNGIYIADFLNYRIRKIDNDGNIHTIAGGKGDGLGAKYAIASISEISFNDDDEMLIADDRQGIRKIDSKGIVSTIVGNGENGLGEYCPDGTNVLKASLNAVTSISVCSGILYFIESGKLRYVKDSSIYTIGSAQQLSCHKATGKLVVSNNQQLYLLQSDLSLKLVSGYAKDSTHADGPLSSTTFTNPVFSFGTSGNLFISEQKEYSNMRSIECESGYRMQDFTTCVRDSCHGKYGTCNGNGKCNLISNQCECQENYGGNQCEIMILTKVIASFKQTSIDTGSRPTITLQFTDFNFEKYYKGRELSVSVKIFESDNELIGTFDSIVHVNQSMIEVNGPAVHSDDHLKFVLSIKDTVTGLNIVQEKSGIDFVNHLTVGEGVQSSGNSAAIAFAVIFAFSSCTLAIALVCVIVYFVRRKPKLNQETAYVLRPEQL